MTIVYIEIFIATRRRLRERARASRINAMNVKTAGKEQVTEQQDQESISSETNHNEHPHVSDAKAHSKNLEKIRRKEKRNKAKDSLKKGDKNAEKLIPPQIVREDSITDIQDDMSDQRKGSNGNDHPATIVELREIKKLSVQPETDKRQSSVYQFIEEKQKISLSKERRAARTLGIIMGVFILSWVPFFLLYIIQPFCQTCCPSDQLIDFLTWLGYSNSMVNPFIYTIFNLDFRRAFRRRLTCVTKQNSRYWIITIELREFHVHFETPEMFNTLVLDRFWVEDID